MISVCEVADNKQGFGDSKRFRNIPYRRLFIIGIFALALCWTLYLPSWDQDALVTLSEEDLLSSFYSTSEKYETLTWVVVLKEVKDGNGEVAANSISKELGLLNLGRVGKLSGHFLLAHPWHEHGLVWPGFNFNKVSVALHSCLASHFTILWLIFIILRLMHGKWFYKSAVKF